MLAVTLVQLQWNLVLALLAALAVGCLVGVLYGLLYTRFGVPSFVITLAGLLVCVGLQVRVLGETGSINLPYESWLVRFSQQVFLAPATAYALAVAVAVGYGVARWTGRRRLYLISPRRNVCRAATTGRTPPEAMPPPADSASRARPRPPRSATRSRLSR